MGGGTSGRAIELFVHLFLTTLFHDFFEINWFVATKFSYSWCRLSWKWNTRYIWGTGSQWEIFASTRLSWNSHTQMLVYRCYVICLLAFAFWRWQINQRGRESIVQKNPPKSNLCWLQSKSTIVLVCCQFKKNWGKITCEIY